MRDVLKNNYNYNVCILGPMVVSLGLQGIQLPRMLYCIPGHPFTLLVHPSLVSWDSRDSPHVSNVGQHYGSQNT